MKIADGAVIASMKIAAKRPVVLLTELFRSTPQVEESKRMDFTNDLMKVNEVQPLGYHKPWRGQQKFG